MKDVQHRVLPAVLQTCPIVIKKQRALSLFTSLSPRSRIFVVSVAQIRLLTDNTIYDRVAPFSWMSVFAAYIMLMGLQQLLWYVLFWESVVLRENRSCLDIPNLSRVLRKKITKVGQTPS